MLSPALPATPALRFPPPVQTSRASSEGSPPEARVPRASTAQASRLHVNVYFAATFPHVPGRTRCLRSAWWHRSPSIPRLAAASAAAVALAGCFPPRAAQLAAAQRLHIMH